MEETPELDRFYRENKDKVGFLIVAVQDTESDVRAVLDQGGYELPVLMDPQGSMAADYRVTGVPTAQAISPAGNLGETIIGGSTAEQLEALVGLAG